MEELHLTAAGAKVTFIVRMVYGPEHRCCLEAQCSRCSHLFGSLFNALSTMQVINTAPPGHDQDQLKESLAKAAAAGESLLQRAGSGTGEALRSNFLLVSEMVESQDAHLLQQPEQDFLCKFRV